MKKIANYLSKTLLTVLLILGFITSMGQSVTIQPDQSGLIPGQIVLVPIIVDATFESCGLYINYDRDVLTPASPFTTAVDPRFNLGLTNSNFDPLINPQAIAYVSVATADIINVTMTSEPLLTLRFVFNGGSSALHLRTTPNPNPICKLFDEVGDQILGVTYTDATMSGPFGTVYSAAAGGLWKNASTWKLDAAGTQAGFVPSGNVNTIITGSPVTADATARAKDLNIRPGGQLTVNSAISLTATGNMLIESNATSTGSFLNNGTLAVTGTTAVQRWVTANWSGGFPNASTLWHYISSPVSGATIATFTGSLLNHWSEPQELWVVDTLPLTLPLTPGKGFSLAKMEPDGIVTFTGGTLNNNASYAPAITMLSSGTFPGWNLIGNPYPCAISWNALTKSNVYGSVYTWNAFTKNYVSYNGTIGSLTGGIIPAEQAFFVQALTNSATITIPNSSRQHGVSPLYKEGIENLVTLKVQGSTAAEDYAFIHFRTDATTGFDQECDTYKLFGTADAPQLYAITPEENLTINSLPSMMEQPVISLGFSGIDDTYNITASDLETFAANTTILLEDLKTNQIINLVSNPVYTFNASSGEPVHRFNLHFATVGLPESKTSGINIYSAEQTVFVNIPADLNGSIIVYNMLGREVGKTTIQSNSINKINLDVPTGFYLVKVDGDVNTATGKVYIR